MILKTMIFCTGTLLSLMLMNGCARDSRPWGDNTAQPLAMTGYHRFDFSECQPLETKGYTKKVENFTILFDPSASMTDAYMASYDCVACHRDFQGPDFAQAHSVTHGGKAFEGKPREEYATACGKCHQNRLYTKFDFAKALTRKINELIPNLKYKGTIRTYGFPAYHNFHYGMMGEDNSKIKTYDKNEYSRAIESLLEAGGVSPMAEAIQAAGKDWFQKEGKIALIIVSDGVGAGEKAVLAAGDLKGRYGENICIHTIMIGNDPYGRSAMDRIAQAGKCGVAVSGDQLLDDRKLERFVRNAFLKRDASCPDEDGDGICDYCDDCPDTGKGRTVDKNGCWDLVLLADVLFDFNKYHLKSEGMAALNQVRNLLRKHPHINLHISGHTDNHGTMAYNIMLSKQRAQSALNFLIRQGINPSRISTSWHAYTLPVATNDTAEGRALNRRVEFKFNRR